MKELRIPALAALAGAIAVAVLFPRLDPAARFPTTLDRAGAIHRAQLLSAKYGVRTDGWRIAVALRTDDKLRRYDAGNPGDPAARLFTPMAWGVLFTAPAGAHTVRVQLFADGRPAEWELRQRDAKAPPLASIPVAPQAILHDFAGGHDSDFHVLSRTPPPWEERLEWEWSGGGRYPLLARLAVIQNNGQLSSVKLQPVYTREAGVPGRVPAVVAGLAGFFGFLTAAFFCIRGWALGRFTWKAPAGMALLMVVWGGAMLWAGSARQNAQYEAAGAEPRSTAGTSPNPSRSPSENFEAGWTDGRNRTNPDQLLGTGAVFGPFVLLFVFGGAGYAVAHGRFRQKWTSLELALRGQWSSRQVCRPAAAGALWGVALAGAPYLLARAASASPAFHGAGVLAGRLAEAGLLNASSMVPAVGFLGFAFPWAAGLRRRFLRIALSLAVIAVFAIPSPNYFDSLGVSVAASILTVAICFYVYRQFDLLAVIAAMATAQAVLVPCILLSQPVNSFRDSGVRAVFVLVAGVTASAYFAIRGHDVESTQGQANLSLGPASDGAPALSSRERLEGEFQVARKAQEHALTAVPAGVEGFTFAAACEPARQVGGDLYDFFPLPDGRLGIAVADVSGKGVPAALYMMVTKGLLDAITRDSSDLRHILESVNRHLHRACKRRVFVTMAAVVIDPGRRRVEYGRAGHNPIVWRRARRGETVLVKPGGLGLGMCSAETFTRSLRIEQMELDEGDALILYSDGITEAINGSMDQFGEERLMRSVERADGYSAAETRSAVLRDLADFTAGTPARDDVTLVAIRVGANSE